MIINIGLSQKELKCVTFALEVLSMEDPDLSKKEKDFIENMVHKLNKLKDL